MGAQLPLDLSLREEADFATFYPGPNREAVAAARAMARAPEGSLYLWGREGVGKTHLLCALCKEAARLGRTAAYLPLGHAGLEPPVMEGLSGYGIVCVDDLERRAGDRAWEEGLFRLYNERRGQGLVLAARASPRQVGMGLPDLASRLASGTVWALHPLGDEERLAALRLRAASRGLDLPLEVGRFLLRRYPRGMSALCEALDRLDEASLSAKRRLTLPFVRAVLRR